MTKPAAVFAQIFGAVLVFFAIGMYAQGHGAATFTLVSGIALFVLGGLSARAKMKQDKARSESAAK